jgi:cellulose synthase/poly-beta-1,6-N-acetylglucosamine synthase-like glycosyltransferase
MLNDIRVYDLFILGFVQLVVCTVLVLSPARNIDTRFRWTGSRLTEMLLGAIAAAFVAGVSAYLSIVLWGLPNNSASQAAYLFAIFSLVHIIVRPDCGVVGKLFAASFAAAGFSFLGYAVLVAAHASRSIAETITASVLIILDLCAFLVWNSNINYVSDVMSRSRRSRPLPVADPNHQPFVSLHLPAYNEPPDIFIETIKAVELIDYPNFEIVVMDNNTTDLAIWQPIEAYCRDRQRLKFVHVAPWPGFKAGACNLALRDYTDPRAEIIGMIDADDIVKPYYLRETAPYFCDERLGFVQTFEGNRDFEGSQYYQACVDSFQGFYLGVMSSRNERDTVPFVGTMGLFRRSALEGVGGWNEWCICEDTEASLRVLKAGWSGLYLPRCFGRGVVPPTFGGLQTQRHRWCFGAMQIMRLHWRSLMPWDRSPDNHLTAAQRRDYLMASLGWFRDLMMLSFALLLLVITGLLLTEANFALMPLAGSSSLLPMSLILIATVCMTWTHRQWTSASFPRAIKSLVISLSACWITAQACVQGLSYREGIFLRTSKKGADHHPIRTALRLSRVETVLALALFAATAALLKAGQRPPLLIFTMLVQAVVFLCAPVAAFWNMRAQRVPAAVYRKRYADQRARHARRPVRTFATLGFAGALLLAASAGGLIAIFASPHDTAPIPAATVGPVELVERPSP